MGDFDRKYRLFWQGKSSKMRLAVQDYLNSKGVKTQNEVAKSHGVTSTGMRYVLRQMIEEGLVNSYVTNKISQLCVKCGKSFDTYPRYKISELGNPENRPLNKYYAVGYLCRDCYNELKHNLSCEKKVET